MFSNKCNIQQLTALILKKGITEAVVCPGSRNSAIVHNLQAAGLTCYNITDERSAGFFAIGLIEANGGKPVAVCVTSGSAVLNLAPAVSEAFYRNFPLLVITADRPERWIGQMDGQTLPQPNAFGAMTVKSVSLPEPTDEEGRWYCNRLINEAFIEMDKTNRPVQINVPITEPMFDFSAPSLQEERLIEFVDNTLCECVMTSNMQEIWKASKKVMIVVGQMLPGEIQKCVPYLKSLHDGGCTIIAETLSNTHTTPLLEGEFIDNFDEMIRTECFETPDFIITLGGHIVSKRLKKLIRQNPPLHHWHISPIGEPSDLFMCCTSLIKANAESLLSSLSSAVSSMFSEVRDERMEYSARLKEKSKECHNNTILTNSFDDKNVLNTILKNVDNDWRIHVANSSMVRNLQQIFSSSNTIHCNRGVNGIEGSVSAAVGYWAGSKSPTLLLTGDLSFFYDQNALWNNYVKSPQSPLRILIINNGCGEIFYHLPGLNSPFLDNSIAASHTTTAEGIAMECHAQYLPATNEEELLAALTSFTKKDNDVRILEVFTSIKN